MQSLVLKHICCVTSWIARLIFYGVFKSLMTSKKLGKGRLLMREGIDESNENKSPGLVKQAEEMFAACCVRWLEEVRYPITTKRSRHRCVLQLAKQLAARRSSYLGKFLGKKISIK